MGDPELLSSSSCCHWLLWEHPVLYSDVSGKFNQYFDYRDKITSLKLLEPFSYCYFMNPFHHTRPSVLLTMNVRVRKTALYISMYH